MKPVQTSAAPEPAGHYQQGLVAGDFVFVSGQGPKDPATGRIPESIEDQVRQTLLNVEAILSAAGARRDDVVRCGVFLTDLDDFAAMNRVYESFFGKHKPTRTTVQAGLRGIKVEIDAIAALKR
jgi:2-iminobutanoate/2-iminopropanoate deaminase